jgi:hypothetical protein
MVNTPWLRRMIVHRLADALPHSLDDASDFAEPTLS